ncbi:hypothetical protein KQI65_14015 [bacterium]|nr:hypothetical protein [bacterium]
MSTHDTAVRIHDEVKATGSGAFLCKEHGRGAVRITGNDTLDLLHRLTTMPVGDLQAGQVRETLLTNEKGRVIDAALVVVQGADVLLLLSEGRAKEVITWLEKYTIMEDCTYEDVSSSLLQYTVYQCGDADALGSVHLPAQGSHAEQSLGNTNMQFLHISSVSGGCIRILCDPASAADAERLLTDAERLLTDAMGIPVIGDTAFTLWRVDNLVPAVGHELSLLANPLESGAAQAVDFEKGCYIGQEVIARLDSYDKVQRKPCSIAYSGESDPAVSVGDTLYSDGKNAGFLTTFVLDPRSNTWRGIALLRHAFADGGNSLNSSAEGNGSTFIVES